jgi:hypothetical protein
VSERVPGHPAAKSRSTRHRAPDSSAGLAGRTRPASPTVSGGSRSALCSPDGAGGVRAAGRYGSASRGSGMDAGCWWSSVCPSRAATCATRCGPAWHGRASGHSAGGCGSRRTSSARRNSRARRPRTRPLSCSRSGPSSARLATRSAWWPRPGTSWRWWRPTTPSSRTWPSAPQDARGRLPCPDALVHAWRRFPFLDPDLPEAVVPKEWPRKRAHDVFGSGTSPGTRPRRTTSSRSKASAARLRSSSTLALPSVVEVARPRSRTRTRRIAIEW